MLLMDSVVHAADEARAVGMQHDPILTPYLRLAEKLQPATGPRPPRYVLDQPAIGTATELTLGRPKVLNQIVRRMVVPARQLWVEWEDAGRETLRQRFKPFHADTPAFIDALKPLPGRMGFFVDTDPTGRRGEITWAWSSKDKRDEIPAVSAVSAFFDQDADGPVDPQVNNDRPLTLAKLWEDNPEQYSALFDIWRTVRHVLDLEAVRPLAQTEFERALLYSDVVGEYLMVWACLLLLTSANKAVELREVDQSRLNRARLKARKSPLLDHRVVHMYVGNNRPKSESVIARGPLGYNRKSPRVHLVTAYPAVRAGKPIVVFPHMRGTGSGVTRTIRVHG